MFGFEKVPAEGSVSLPEQIRVAAEIEPGDLVTFRVTGSRSVEVTAHRIPTLAEVLERFTIDGPIDEAADREEWQDAAAAGLFRRMDDESEAAAALAYAAEREKTVEE